MTRRARPGDPLVAVAYLRVSTDDQELGMAAQRTAIEAWAARAGVTVAAWHEDDGVSGASPIDQRPGLCAALADLRALGAGVLVVGKRDRIARDVIVAALTERAATAAGARLVLADGTGNGDTAADAFMRTIIDGAAAYERALIRARTVAGMAEKKRRGERVGTVAYGWRIAAAQPPASPSSTPARGRRAQRPIVLLERDEAEQGVLDVIRELRAAGLSQRAIAAELEARGLLSRAGTPFGQTQIARLTKAA